MSTASLNGITLAYEEYEEYGDGGERPALVLVHGHPFDRTMWRPQATAFAREGWRVITPDLRGYGASTVVPGVTTLDAFARDIAALLDHLGVRRFVLGGLSMGGQIVMECHRLFPGRIRALLLADTFAAAETEAGRRHRNATADRLVREGMAGYAGEELPRMIAPGTLASSPDVAQHVLTMMSGTPPEGAAAALRGRAERPDYAGTLARVAVPTLVVVGDEDEFTPLPDARRIHELVRGSTLEVIPGAGHLPNLERPAAFNAALRRFLDALPPF